MATQAAIRQRIYDYLYGAFPTESPFVSRLGASYTSGATSITVLDGTQWEVNDVCENTETGEQFKVISISGNVLTVIPGWAGTTQANSSGTDDVLYKNPRFTQQKLDDAITATLAEFERWGIHVFGTGSFVRADPKVFYELSETDIIDHIGVLKVYHVMTNSEYPAAIPFRYQYNLGTSPAEYSQGQGIHVGHFGDTSDTDTIYYLYAQKVDAVGDLLTRQEELCVVGAVAILMGGTIAPTTHDPGARTDRTVSPGQTSRDVRYFRGRFITEARLETAELSVERQRMVHEAVPFVRARRWVS